MRLGKLSAGLLVLFAGAVLYAADGTWTNDFDSVWSDPTNWLNGVVADGAGSTAVLAPSMGSTVNITLDSSRTLGRIEAQPDCILTNGGNDSVTLAMAGTGTPEILLNSALRISRLIMAGNQGLIVNGPYTLMLYKENGNPANTISGTLIISNGATVAAGGVMVDGFVDATALALGTITDVVFLNGTLNLRPSGSTVEPGTSLVRPNLYVPEGCEGTIVLPLRWVGASGDGVANPGNGFGGSLTGKGLFTVDSQYVRGNVTGNWSGFEGVLRIQTGARTDNEFRYAGGPGFPNATVELAGSQPMTFRYYLGLTSNTIFGIGRLQGDNSQSYVAGSATAAYTLFWNVGGLMTNASEEVTFAGAFVNGSGPCGVIYSGAGRWVLTGNSTHTGGTIISNGILQVGPGWGEYGTLGNGAVTNYSKLVFARDGVLEVFGPVVGPGLVSNIGMGTVILRGSNSYSGATYVANGKVYFGGGSAITGPVIVSDNAGIGAWIRTAGAQAQIGNLTLGSGTTLDFDLGNVPNPTNAVLTLANDGTLQMSGDVVTVNIAGSKLSVGTIPLLKYGSRSGSGSFTLGTLPMHVTGAYLQDDTVNRVLNLVITSTFDPTLVWVGDALGNWNTDPANRVWKVAGSGVATNYYDGAMVKFDDTATGTTTVTLDSYVYPAKVTFDNSTKTYTVNGFGGISGTATIIKTGTGQVTLNTANDFTGGMDISGGTLQIGDGTSAATIGSSGAITNNGLLIFKTTANQTVSGVISGTGTIRQEGPGELTLSGNNTFVGAVEVMPGARLVNNNANAVGSTGSRLILKGGVTYLTADIGGGHEVIIETNSVIGSHASNRRIDSPIYSTNSTLVLSNNGLLTIHASLRGFVGTIVLQSPNGSALRFNAGGTVCDGSPTTVFEFQPAPSYTNWLYNRNAGVIYLGGIQGGPGVISEQSTSGGDNLVTYLVGDAGQNNVFTGWIQDSGRNTAFIKVGPATLTLSNVVLNHKGTFGVTNGTLAFKGYTTVSPVTTNVLVGAPGVLDLTAADTPTMQLGTGTVVQHLRGDGLIKGNVVLGNNARLRPGITDGRIGTLTVQGNVTLGGITTMELNRDGSPNCDRLVATAIAGGGQLIVTNLGGALQAGDTFQLFSVPVTGFSSVSLPELASPLYWTNLLAVDGSIKVMTTQVIPTYPTNITYHVQAGQIEISWPDTHIGWALQVQTNTLSVGLSTNWVTVPGSQLTNRVAFPIGDNQATFFRLVLTQ